MWIGYNKSYLTYFCILHKLDYDSLCLKFKLSKDILNKFLEDDKNLTVNELEKIANILEVYIDKLFIKDDTPNKILKFL